jgi:hypothetical protein
MNFYHYVLREREKSGNSILVDFENTYGASTTINWLTEKLSN